MHKDENRSIVRIQNRQTMHSTIKFYSEAKMSQYTKYKFVNIESMCYKTDKSIDKPLESQLQIQQNSITIHSGLVVEIQTERKRCQLLLNLIVLKSFYMKKSCCVKVCDLPNSKI